MSFNRNQRTVVFVAIVDRLQRVLVQIELHLISLQRQRRSRALALPFPAMCGSAMNDASTISVTISQSH